VHLRSTRAAAWHRQHILCGCMTAKIAPQEQSMPIAKPGGVVKTILKKQMAVSCLSGSNFRWPVMNPWKPRRANGCSRPFLMPRPSPGRFSPHGQEGRTAAAINVNVSVNDNVICSPNDVLNRLTSMVDALGTTRYTYNTAGRLLTEGRVFTSGTLTNT
jgi:YD repeat-containing protein